MFLKVTAQYLDMREATSYLRTHAAIEMSWFIFALSEVAKITEAFRIHVMSIAILMSTGQCRYELIIGRTSRRASHLSDHGLPLPIQVLKSTTIAQMNDIVEL